MSLALPLYNSVAEGHDSYVGRSVLNELVPKYTTRWWRHRGKLVSAQLKGGGIVKALERFDSHCTESTFMSLLDELYTAGIRRPSSYADIFYQSVRLPRLRWTVNAPFYKYLRGGWQEARQLGVLRGKWKKYDLNSAYLWSLTRGLPEPRTLRPSRRPEYSDVTGFTKPGLYVVELDAVDWNLPYPFNSQAKHYIASTEEIETYGLRVSKYHIGYTWDANFQTDHWLDIIGSFSCHKQIGRSYWGRWASVSSLQCHVKGKRWPLRNAFVNAIWAHCIISRVKMKVWAEAMEAAHVFVDSVIVPSDYPVQTGSDIGDWREVTAYPDGLNIRGPGIYGEPGKPLEKHAGLSLDFGVKTA